MPTWLPRSLTASRPDSSAWSTSGGGGGGGEGGAGGGEGGGGDGGGEGLGGMCGGGAGGGGKGGGCGGRSTWHASMCGGSPMWPFSHHQFSTWHHQSAHCSAVYSGVL